MIGQHTTQPWKFDGTNLVPQSTSTKVGIGTASPDRLLHLQQNEDSKAIKIAGFDDVSSSTLTVGIDSFGHTRIVATGILSLASGAGWTTQFTGNTQIFDDSMFIFGLNNDYAIGYSNTDDTLQIVDGNAIDTNVRIALDSSGNVGIGTDAPSVELDVVGLGLITSDSASNGLTVIQNGAGAALHLAHGTAGTFAARSTDLLFGRHNLLTSYLNAITNSQSGTIANSTMSFELASGASTRATALTVTGAQEVISYFDTGGYLTYSYMGGTAGNLQVRSEDTGGNIFTITMSATANGPYMYMGKTTDIDQFATFGAFNNVFNFQANGRPLNFRSNTLASIFQCEDDTGVTNFNYQVNLNSDSIGLYFGGGQDASIYYDGTDLIIDPQEVGTGVVDYKVAEVAADTNTPTHISTPTDVAAEQTGWMKVKVDGNIRYIPVWG